MGFATWIHTFITEKGLDWDHLFEVQGPRWGSNWIPLSVVVDTAIAATPAEQHAIKNMLVRIDYRNADPMGYFAHLAQGMAL